MVHGTWYRRAGLRMPARARVAGRPATIIIDHACTIAGRRGARMAGRPGAGVTVDNTARNSVLYGVILGTPVPKLPV